MSKGVQTSGGGSASGEPARPWKSYWDFRAAIQHELPTRQDEREPKLRPFHAPRKGRAYRHKTG